MKKTVLIPSYPTHLIVQPDEVVMFKNIASTLEQSIGSLGIAIGFMKQSNKTIERNKRIEILSTLQNELGELIGIILTKENNGKLNDIKLRCRDYLLNTSKIYVNDFVRPNSTNGGAIEMTRGLIDDASNRVAIASVDFDSSDVSASSIKTVLSMIRRILFVLMAMEESDCFCEEAEKECLQ